MLKGLYTAASGMKVQQVNVDVIANNLANVNTAGFKRTQANFQDLLYVILREPGAQSANGFNTPSGVQIGSGAELTSTTKVFTPGVLEQTDRSEDLAILGEGFFEVDLPSGGQAYTRDGGFRLDANGVITTAQGYRLRGSITIPIEASKTFTVAPDGTVSTRDDATGIQTKQGQIQVARFANPAGLRSGGGNLLYSTPSSGDPQISNPGEQGTGGLGQGILERSN